jgi:hypothetical protein
MSSPLSTLAMGVIEAGGTIAQGNAQYEAAKLERKQLGRMASEELAVATRNAEGVAKEGRLMTSRGQAVAASSGGMATDDTVLELISGIAQEGNVRQRGALREGQVKADDLLYRGRVGVKSAKFQKGLSRWAAGGTMLQAASDAAAQAAGMGGGGSGFSSAFLKYGAGMQPASVSPSQQQPWYKWG